MYFFMILIAVIGKYIVPSYIEDYFIYIHSYCSK